MNKIKELWNKANEYVYMTELIIGLIVITALLLLFIKIQYTQITKEQQVPVVIEQTNFPADYIGEFNFTHYSPTGNRTKTGNIPKANKTIAVDPKLIPLHSVVYIENLGYFIAEDTGGLIKGNKIDIFVSSKEEAIKLGTLNNKKLKVWIMRV